ncbi:MAG: DUF2141 domain-containing protein [Paludibacter sp.]|jgi:uncharacterized protein (DUF2141 family)|nr:DUF2141 domain-containing protein [Paludibacter sp.]
MMQKVALTIVYALFSLGLMAQLSLTVEITNLRNCRGTIHGELRNEKDQPVAAVSRKIVDNQCFMVFEKLLPGSYAFQFIHDENSNKSLDTNWLGIPNEGFGYSNNPSLLKGPPTLKRILFELTESTVLNCKTIYLFSK